MTKEEIKNTPAFKAAHIAFQNGLLKGYDIQAMSHYMFLQGMKFQKTGEIPKDELNI